MNLVGARRRVGPGAEQCFGAMNLLERDRALAHRVLIEGILFATAAPALLAHECSRVPRGDGGRLRGGVQPPWGPTVVRNAA
eukprot:151043-Pyramimonas_sp.AAC.1